MQQCCKFFPKLSDCISDFTKNLVYGMFVTDVLVGGRMQFTYLCALRYSLMMYLLIWEAEWLVGSWSNSSVGDTVRCREPAVFRISYPSAVV